MKREERNDRKPNTEQQRKKERRDTNPVVHREDLCVVHPATVIAPEHVCLVVDVPVHRHRDLVVPVEDELQEELV